MSDMKIESIETIPVRVALDRTYRGSYYHMPNRCTVVTRIKISAGIIGEAYNADTDIEQAEILTIIERELAPALLGQDAFNIERNWETMNKVTRDQLRDRRIAIQAMACVDTALWDAIGKAVDQPLYRLWGGYRDAIPMIGIGGYYEEPGMPSIEDEVEAFLNDGMVGMKFKIGGRSPEVDAGRLKRAVDAAPDGWTFIVRREPGLCV